MVARVRRRAPGQSKPPFCGKSARTERMRINTRETNVGIRAGDEVSSEEVSGSSVASDQLAPLRACVFMSH